MREGAGCLWIVVFVLVVWGIIAYLIYRPPDLEDIPWIVAGVLVAIILKIYRRERQD